jgi:uncharacterized RDD family membrane protein YckC
MENHKFAGFWIRFAACLIDSIILQIGMVIISIPILIISGIDSADKGNGLLDLFLFLIGILYYIILTCSKYQATLGKKIVGIYVINGEGKRLSAANALGRYCAYIISALTICIGFMMAGWSNKKRAYGNPGGEIIKP